MTKRSPKPLHGRGAASNPDDRFAAHGREWADDGWGSLEALPERLAALISEWLAHHAPLKAAHVMSRLRACRGGKAYDSRFDQRLTGSGDYAELLSRRFTVAVRKLGF